MNDTTLPSKELTVILRRALLAVCTDDARINLSHIRIEPIGDTGTRIVSTDGHRLHTFELADVYLTDHPVLVHRHVIASALALIKLGKYAKFSADDGRVSIGGDHSHVSARPEVEAYPDYQQLLNTVQVAESKLIGNARKLLKEVKALACEQVVIANEQIYSRDDALNIKGVCVHAHYLMQALKLCGSEDVVIETTGDRDPIMVRALDATAMVMPAAPTP